ncbi:class I SAM-dependent DNA methyltransferase [Actinocorallia populi]|uniref:class I SAM-dependent DNA methyltransferase n=1 Tax=Actinocorallia populi TaxID=2079200 RepID=UPI000D097196|nr:class I SAM-dependent DNA methyltransferase [Actinocorallia populi]
MPPRKKPAGQGELPGVAPVPTLSDIKDTLWKAADKLRGSMDAAQYKDFVLSLVFLKYVSDTFEEQREEVRKKILDAGIPEEQLDTFLEDKDYYEGDRVFWVPEQARWSYLSENSKSAGIGVLLDAAMQVLMDENPPLRAALKKIFNQDNVDQRRLGQLIDLISNTQFTGHQGRTARDVLGEVYEYFLEKFARAEGKRGGEFYTPGSVVKLLVEVLEPFKGRIYDPCCGSGGMFVQAEKFVEQHRGKNHLADLAIYGQEANERTWRLATMNLAIHNLRGDLSSRWADTFYSDKHPDLKADYILANPPFNMSDWHRDPEDPRWRFGVPPAGNANFAWMQHIIYKLGERGAAGVVMANGSMSSKQSGEGDIRANLVENDLVSCMIALPPQLFRTTQIPACLWFFAKDKSARDGHTDRRGQVLFIDARAMGTMLDRTERVLTEDDLRKISDAYHAWRGTSSAGAENLTYENVPGFCYSATRDEIREHDHILTPGRYVGAAEQADTDDEPIADKINRLTKELFAHFDESARLEQVIREQMERLDV